MSKMHLSFEDYIAGMKSEIAKHMATREAGIDSDKISEPSMIWHTALLTHRYILNLRADDLRLVRYHTSFLTGNNIYDFWHPNPPVDPDWYAERVGYDYLTDGLPEEFHVIEPSIS